MAAMVMFVMVVSGVVTLIDLFDQVNPVAAQRRIDGTHVVVRRWAPGDVVVQVDCVSLITDEEQAKRDRRNARRRELYAQKKAARLAAV